jgi:hypothetical protein
MRLHQLGICTVQANRAMLGGGKPTQPIRHRLGSTYWSSGPYSSRLDNCVDFPRSKAQNLPQSPSEEHFQPVRKRNTPCGEWSLTLGLIPNPNRWTRFFLKFFDPRPNDLGIVMGAANYPQRTIEATPLLPSGVLLRLLAALGVLAFIFSATSPDDDDIQQEFYRTSKLKPCAFVNYKAVSNLRTFRIGAVCSALAANVAISSHFDTVRVSVPSYDKGRVCNSGAGDRSPPTKSS